MQDLKNDLKTVFNTEIKETDEFLKINVQQLNNEYFKKLYIITLKHAKKINKTDIKRSGNGLAIFLSKKLC